MRACDSVAGGAHEGVGTHNRLVPLGADYVELLAIADPDEAAASPLGGDLPSGSSAATG